MKYLRQMANSEAVDISGGAAPDEKTPDHQGPPGGTHPRCLPNLIAVPSANPPLSQVTKLCGPEPLTKWVVLLVVSIQVAAAYLLRNQPILSWQYLLTAYIVGATANQNLFLAIHEISHNLAFRAPVYNRVLAVFANLPIGIPYSASFRVTPPSPSTPPPQPGRELIHEVSLALPSYPPQSARRRGPRHRPPHPL